VDVPLEGNRGDGSKVYSHDVIVTETLDFIRANRERPFFCYAPWTLPHGKHVVPDASAFKDKPWPQQVRNCAAMIALLDRDTGRVLDLLKELGIEKDTLVIFTSDNGPNPPFVKPLGSGGGLRGVKRSLYEGGIRAPMVAWWPGTVAAGSTSDLVCGHLDWFATCAEIAASPPPETDDGISLLPTLKGKDGTKPREAMYWEIWEGAGGFQQAVRMGGWKGYRKGADGPMEVYDLSKDPGETKNLAGSEPDVATKIAAIMKREHVPSPHYGKSGKRPKTRK
jgi:arylsulfatase A-like enzyme